MVDFVQRLFQQANTAQRSTALNPLGWMLVILAAMLVGVSYRESLAWIQSIILTLICINAACYLFAYAYFAWTNPDALRSEKFSLTKLAIERGLRGDNVIGLVDPESGGEAVEPRLLPTTSGGGKNG